MNCLIVYHMHIFGQYNGCLGLLASQKDQQHLGWQFAVPVFHDAMFQLYTPFHYGCVIYYSNTYVFVKSFEISVCALITRKWVVNVFFSIWWNLVAFNAYFDQFTITENSHIQNSNGIVKADHTFYLKFDLAHNDHHQLTYVQNRLYHVKYEYGKCQ